MEKTIKRILAIVAIVLLAALYIVTLVLACMGKATAGWFTACIFATIMVPLLLYIYSWLYKLVKKQMESSRSGKNIPMPPQEDLTADGTAKKETGDDSLPH